MESRGGAVVAVLRLLLFAELYERFVSPERRESIETPWWAVYVIAAPLLFGPDPGVAPVALLFCTRFVVECLRERPASADWLFALLARATPRAPPPSAALAPLLAE